ncbi:MAG: DUF5615 family PIN-like protein [bacterium]
MKILVDENVPKRTVRELRSRGHDVKDIRKTELEGVDDEPLWQLAQKERRLLITTDKGFRNNRNKDHCGLLIVRLKQPNRLGIHKRIMTAMRQVSPDEWPGLMVTMRTKAQQIWRKP